VDTLGLLLVIVVHAANVQDRDGAKLALRRAQGYFPRLRRIWADGGYAGKLVDWVLLMTGWALDIVKRSDGAQGFVALPHRWIVERTFGWLGRSRRLSKDYEELCESSEAMVQLAMIRLMLRRLVARYGRQPARQPATPHTLPLAAARPQHAFERPAQRSAA